MAFRKGLPETPQKKDLTKFTVYILRLIEVALRITIVRCLLSTVRCPLLQSPCECVCNVFIKNYYCSHFGFDGFSLWACGAIGQPRLSGVVNELCPQNVKISTRNENETKRNDIKNVPTMSAHIAQGTSCTRVLKMKKTKTKTTKITHSVYKSLSRSVSRSIS